MISTIIAIVSTVFAILFGFFTLFFGIQNYRRNKTADTKASTAEMTTVLVKLENMNDTMKNGFFEIKSEMSSIKNEVKDNFERLVKVEASERALHKRLDSIEGKVS